MAPDSPRITELRRRVHADLAAIRGRAEIHQRRGELAEALAYYRRALELARFDPELEEAVNRIGRELGALSDASVTTTDRKEPSALSGAALIDFDALLASLGVPDASPPPVMELLLSQSAPPTPEAIADTSPAMPITAPDDERFAELERGLRDLQEHSAASTSDPNSTSDPAATQVVEELEAWLRVLEAESNPLSQTHSTSQGV